MTYLRVLVPGIWTLVLFDTGIVALEEPPVFPLTRLRLEASRSDISDYFFMFEFPFPQL